MNHLIFLIPILGCLIQCYFFFDPLTRAYGLQPLHTDIHILSIGQGDSILITTPEQRRILVDGGPEGEQTLRELQKVLPFLERKIDLLILTHEHKDHFQGFFTIMDRMEIGALVLAKESTANPEMDELRQRAKENNIQMYYADSSQDIKIDSYTYIDILSPSSQHLPQKNINNNSLTFMLHTTQDQILFMGDAEQELEQELLREGNNMEARIIKGGHHGSSTSTTEELLENSSPEFVIYSNGENNSFHHPHTLVLDRLRERKIPFWNTSVSGTVHIACPIYHPCTITPQADETL